MIVICFVIKILWLVCYFYQIETSKYCATFLRLCECNIRGNLTGKHIHLAAILVSIEAIRSRLLDTREGGAW